jgi:hypothetical protein
MAQSIVLSRLATDPTLGDFDVAAGVHETTLNSFSNAHHKMEHAKPQNVYVGRGELEELRIKFNYDISAPATFDLTPFDGAREYKRWLLQLPEVIGERTEHRIKPLVDEVPPTIKVYIPKIAITLTPQGGAAVILEYALTVIAYTAMTGAGELQIVPLSAVVSDPRKFDADIQAAISRSGNPQGRSEGTCYELKELIKYVVNVTLSQRISSFLLQIPLPSPIKLFDGVSLSQIKVIIAENFAVFTAKAVPSLTAFDFLTPPTFKGDIAELKAFTQVADAAVVSRMQGAEKLTLTTRVATAKEIDALGFPATGLFLYMSRNLFQLVANAVLPQEQTGGECRRWGIFEGCYDWFMKIANPRVAIDHNNLNIDFDFSGRAGVRARVHTHCGPTGWIGVGLKARAVPMARAVANLFVKNNKELMLSAGPRPFAIHIETIGVPFPISEIIGAILTILGTIGEAIASLAGVRLTMKLADFPEKFPGTDMGYTADIKHDIMNVDGNLAMMARIKFHP